MKWDLIQLGHLYEVHNGLTKEGKHFGKGFPFLTFSQVFNNWFIPSELTSLVQSSEKEQLTFSIKRGDIFITRTSETINELGMSSVALKDYPLATYNGFTKRLRPLSKSKVLPEFIGYYLRSPLFRSGFMAFSNMITRASLRNDDLLSMKIPVPPINEQHRIAGVLKAYDDLIDINQKQIILLEEATMRIFNEWFVNQHFPNYETTPIIDDVPRGWFVDNITSSVTLQSGFAFKSADFNDDGSFKIITIKNVKNGQFDNANFNKIVNIPKNMPVHCYLKDGDILLSLTGNVGRVCLVFGTNFLLNQRVAKLKSNTPSFTYCLFRSKMMFDTMNNLANGAAQQNLSPVQTGKIKVLFPTKELINRFEEIAQPMIEKVITLNKAIAIAKHSRDALLPRLMEGELKA